MNQRWTVITGASSGIGAEMARLFAARGHSLVLVARRAERLDALKREIEGAGQVRVETVALDLEQPDTPDELVRTLGEREITVHTLVNNAGFGLRGAIRTLPYQGQIDMLTLNVVAPTRLARAILPGLVERRSGGIINVASTAAFQAVPYLGIYAATKAYMLSFSEALHEELRGSGVVVTALCPGPTRTEFTQRANMEKSKMFSYAMSAETVARLAIEGYEAGRAVVITGGVNRSMAFMTRLAPRSLLRWAAGKLQG